MRYLSLFSGIEAATVAWQPMGWTCVGVSEIDAFPSAVLARHHPEIENLGDVTRLTEQRIAALGRIDIIVFGSPCQDLSVAGKRKGFVDDNGATTRSGLFFTAMQIVEWAKQHCDLRFALWENVLGAFSSNRGSDFAEVVGNLAGIDSVEIPPKGWGTEGCAVGKEGMVEWSTLDAQWFGVAQRRRRVFALADFGDWASRPPLLLESESMRGHTPPSREAGERTTGNAEGNTGKNSGCIRNAEPGLVLSAGVSPTLPARRLGGGGLGTDFDLDGGLAIAMAHGQAHAEIAVDCTPALTCNHEAPIIAFHSNAQPDEMRFDEHVSSALTCSQFPAVAYSTKLHNTTNNQAGKFYEEYTVALDSSSPPPAGIAAFKAGQGSTAGGIWYAEEIAPTLTSAESGPNLAQYLLAATQVRRLTPRECERLQGFPDGYTAIPWRGKPAQLCPDAPRYKALGNSMAVPVMRWIGKQLDLMRFF